MKKSITFFFLFFLLNLQAQGENGSYFGFYAGVNQAFLHSDLFESSSGTGYQFGLSAGNYIHEKGDIIVEIELTTNIVKVHGTYAEESAHEGENIMDVYRINNAGVNTYYNHYFIINDEGNGFYVSGLGGFKLTIGNDWRLASINDSQDDIYYGHPLINSSNLTGYGKFNTYYGFGIAVGTYKLRAVLMYHHSLSDLLGKTIYKEYYDGGLHNDAESVTGIVKLSSISLNLIYKL